MQTLNLASAPATETQAASIIVMDNINNVFCTIYADGKIKMNGENPELLVGEMQYINTVLQNFDLFFRNIPNARPLDMSNFGDPVEWQREIRKDRNIGRHE